MANYVVVALRATGDKRQIEHTFRGAPSEARLAATFRSGLNQYDLAVRYYPSRKGWLIIDMRYAFATEGASGIPYWTNTRRSPKVYPSESAAVMKAIYILNPPGQHELKL